MNLNLNQFGINQTLHRIYLKIKCKASILTPFKSVSKTIENKMLFTTLQILVGGLIYACLNYKYIFQMIRGERLSWEKKKFLK